MRLASVRTLALTTALVLLPCLAGCGASSVGRVPTPPSPISILVPPGAPPAGPTTEED